MTGETTAGTTGAGTTGAMTDPGSPAAPKKGERVADLAEMIGHYLSVHVTYVHTDGHDEHVDLVGMVTAVAPLVSVSPPTSAEPFTLPPDPKSYRVIPRSAFAPDSWGETPLSPRYETTWRVHAPAGAASSPAAKPFEPPRPGPSADGPSPHSGA
jgi:hypothetical protein